MTKQNDHFGACMRIRGSKFFFFFPISSQLEVGADDNEVDKEIKQEIKQEEAEKKKTAALVLKKLFAGDDTIYDSMKDQQDEEDEQYPEKLYPPPEAASQAAAPGRCAVPDFVSGCVQERCGSTRERKEENSQPCSGTHLRASQ